MDNATSRKEVEIAVDNAFYVIKHYYYTLLNDNEAREKLEKEGVTPKGVDNLEQAKVQLESNRNQQKPIEELLAQAKKLKTMIADEAKISYRIGSEPFSD